MVFVASVFGPRSPPPPHTFSCGRLLSIDPLPSIKCSSFLINKLLSSPSKPLFTTIFPAAFHRHHPSTSSDPSLGLSMTLTVNSAPTDIILIGNTVAY